MGRKRYSVNKAVLLRFILMLVSVVVIAGGFFYWGDKFTQERKEVNQLKDALGELQSELEKNRIDKNELNQESEDNQEIIETKGYENAIFSYKVDYPSNWFVYDVNVDGKRIFDYVRFQSVEVADNFEDIDKIEDKSARISVIVHEDLDSISDWVDKKTKINNSLGTSTVVVKDQDVEIGGVKGKLVIIDCVEDSGDSCHEERYKLIEKDGKVFEFFMQTKGVDFRDYSVLFDDFLNSFSFVENVDEMDVSSWEEYGNEKLKIGFKYPQGWIVVLDRDLKRIYISSHEGEISKGDVPDNFKRLWVSYDEGKIIEKEKYLGARQVSDLNKEEVELMPNFSVYLYDYLDVDLGRLSTAFWRHGDYRFMINTASGVGKEDQEREIEILKKMIYTIRLQ